MNNDFHFIAIFENGGAQRWRAKGCGGFGCWESGSLQSLGVLNLSEVWNLFGTSNWKFEPLRSYTVQVVGGNSNCGSWTERLYTFFVCPTGSGCREQVEQSQKMVFSPNPASDKFSLTNFTVPEYNTNDYTLTLTDITGRQVKAFSGITNNEFDVSDLPNGIYVATLRTQNRILQHGKVSVKK